MSITISARLTRHLFPITAVALLLIATLAVVMMLSFGILTVSAQESTPAPRLDTVGDVTAEPGAVPGTVVLQWEPVAEATIYWIYLQTIYGTQGRFWPRAVDGALRTETVTGLYGGKGYRFHVMAVSDAGQTSEWSEAVEATPTKPEDEEVLYNDHNHRVALVQYVRPYGDEIQIAIAIGDPTNSGPKSTDIIKIKAESLVKVLDRHFRGDEWRSGNRFYSGTDAPATTPPDAPSIGFKAGDLYLKVDDCDIYGHDGEAWGETPVMAMQCD